MLKSPITGLQGSTRRAFPAPEDGWRGLCRLSLHVFILHQQQICTPGRSRCPGWCNAGSKLARARRPCPDAAFSHSSAFNPFFTSTRPYFSPFIVGNRSHYMTTQQYGEGEEVHERTEIRLLKGEETGQTEGLRDKYPPLEKR